MGQKAYKERLKLLDGLRGIAALWVALMHFQTTAYELSPARLPFVLDQLFKYGHVGVNIFFVLSGFVIAYSIRFQDVSFAYIGRFFLRRSLRLDPPYWMALFSLTGLIYLGHTLFGKGESYLPNAKELTLNAFYLQNLLQVKNILPVAWTLCLEIQFYLVFILLVKGIQTLNKRGGYSLNAFDSPASLGIFGFFLLFSIVQDSPFFPSPPGFFLPFWHSFFAGALLCWGWLSYIQEKYVLWTLVFIALSALLSKNSDLAITVAIAFLLWGCCKKGYLASGLAFAPLQALGRISYSFYLIHWIAGMKALTLMAYFFPNDFQQLPAIASILIALMISLAASNLFYRLVEGPSLRLSKAGSVFIAAAWGRCPQSPAKGFAPFGIPLKDGKPTPSKQST